MSSRAQISRHTSLAATAGALIALMVVGAAMSATPGAGAVAMDARAGAREEDAMRAMCAAVAAAARSLAGGERVLHAGPVMAVMADAPAPVGMSVTESPAAILHGDTLVGRERLDLPPPTC